MNTMGYGHGWAEPIVEIASRFAALPADSLDAGITDGLGRFAETMQFDRVLVWQLGDETAVTSHDWGRVATAGPGTIGLDAIPFIATKLAAGEATWFAGLGELPHQSDRDTFERLGLDSAAVVPLSVTGAQGQGRWAIVYGTAGRETTWTPTLVEQLRLTSAVVGQAMARRKSEIDLHNALDEVRQLRERTGGRSVPVERRPAARNASLIVPESAAIKAVLAQVEQVALTPATVLLLGETGSGKEVFAEYIHNLSPRHQRQMIRVNCAAIPSALIESELFGRERGAYTDAISRQIGRFELANHSTLFLDEIGELTPEVQVKLLRVLQERVIERLGSTQPIKVDVRIIAATNRNLEQAVADGTFREDLFYRLNVFPIEVPPLRSRVEDIPELVWAFVDEFSQSFGRTIESIAKESMREMQQYAWPGNVRELRNVIERAMILATGPRLTVSMPAPVRRKAQPAASSTLADVELQHVRATLDSTNWRIRGRGGAAERLGLKPTTLESRMAKLGLSRPGQSAAAM